MHDQVMRFQGDLVPADRTFIKADEASTQVDSDTGVRVVDGPGEQQPVGPRHDPAQVAAAVTAAIQGLGMTVEIDAPNSNENDPNDDDPNDDGPNNRELDSFTTIDVQGKELSVLVSPTKCRGDDRSGRPLQVAFVVDVDWRVTTEVRFDHVVDQGRELWEWESLVLDLLERNREWTPQWALAAVPLLTAAGRDLSYKRISS